jgi:WD40 repeat protein/tetratricopeptide (TPR) repeat protein
MSDESKLAVANISSENEAVLQELSMTLDLYEGEFKLLLVRCNYQDLRDRLIIRLKEIHPQPIFEIKLPRSQKALYNHIIAQVKSETPAVLSIVGMDELDDLQAALLDLNINREMFRNHCPYPIVWWISDAVHKRIIKVAPDFESWTTTLEFPIDTDELLTSLHDGSEALFSHVLAPSEVPFFKKLGEIHQLGSIQCSELEIALKDLGDRGLNLEPKLQANLNFIRGLDTLPPNNSPEKALQYLQASFNYWQEVQDIERCGLLINQIGQVNYTIADADKYRAPNWELAMAGFQSAIEFFEKINRSDFVANIIIRLFVTAYRMSDWDAVEAFVQKALPLHQEFHEPYHLSLDYRYLAEVALQRQEWEVARNYGKMALSFLDQSPQEYQKWRNLYLFIIAQAEIQLKNNHEGLKLLLEAKELGDTGHPQIYIKLLTELRSLYTKQKQYLEAYVTKQEQYAIEQQYGYRAFIGAGRLQGKKSVGKSQTDVATEIEASGRKHDLDELITRIAKPSYKLIVLYGKSGVGKSSLVNAGLIPQLEHTSFEGRDVCAIAIRVYTNWEEELEKALALAQGRSPLPPLQRGALDDLNNSVPLSKGDAEGRGIEPMLVDGISAQDKELKLDGIISKLREKESQNKRLVLIFDQFEEFFFVYYNQPTERRRFFEFIGKLLNDSQNLSSLKVVLSLREDYLHYLLECNQIESMAAIDQDILSKNVLYRVGNLKVEAAKSLIQTLTEKSRFYLEPELIGAIADDLKDELGEVRPIELQVVGAQLQQEGIKALEQYRLLGVNPKAILVERYLNDVIVDCGEENNRLAKFLLFMLTDERGTRPLKTRVELEKDLQDLLTEMQGDTSALDLVLEIFVRSGLVVLIPESPLDRYQLVHDYLAEFIRASQAPEMAKLQQELAETKETLRETVDRLSVAVKEEEAAKFRARGRSRLAFGVGIVASVMAVGAGIAGFMALKTSVDSQFVTESYKMLSLLNGNLQLEALVEAVETGERLQKDKIASPDTEIRVITSIQEVVYAMKEKNRLLGHSSGVRSVAFSPDGKTIATGSGDNTVKLWNLEGKEIQTLKGHSSGVTSVAFSPDGKTIATGSWDNTVKLWNLEGKEIQTLKGHSSIVLSVAFSPDGKTIATGSGDNTVKLWNLEGKEIQTLKGHSSIVWSVAFSPDGKTIATGSWDNTVKLWNLEGKEIQTLKGHSSIVRSVAFSPDGKTIATGSGDNTVKLWNLEGKEIQTLKGHSASVSSVAFSPDGKTIATGSGDNTVKLWNLEGKEIQTLKGHSARVSSVAFSPDGKTIATGSEDNTVKLWNLEGKETQTLKGHSSGVMSVAFSPDGKTIATGSVDNTVKLWNLEGKEIQTLKGHSSSVSSVAFSPDGKTIVTGSGDNTVKLWNLEGKEIQTLKGHSSGVSSVAFSLDGKTIATGSGDNTIKLWNLEGKETQTLKGHSSGVSSVAFSLDGKTIATGSVDSTVKLWSLDLDRQMGLACYGLQEFIATQPELQQKLATCRDPQTLKAAAPALVAEARTKGMKGKPEAALSLFQEAKKLDRSITLDPQTEINPYFIPKGERLAQEGNIKAALVAYDEAIKRNPNIKVPADSWATLCWNGSIYNSAKNVIFACDNAIKLEPDRNYYLQRRAIAKVIAGQNDEAIGDFESYLKLIYNQKLKSLLFVTEGAEYLSFGDEEVQGWLEELKAGKNPITEEKLEEWRQHAKRARDS